MIFILNPRQTILDQQDINNAVYQLTVFVSLTVRDTPILSAWFTLVGWVIFVEHFNMSAKFLGV